MMHLGAILDMNATHSFLKEHFKSENWCVEISGGEPLFVPGLEHFVRLLKRLHIPVVILTNGTNMRWKGPYIPRGTRLLMTWHIEQCSFDEFRRSVSRARDFGHRVFARTVLTPEQVLDGWGVDAKKNLETLRVPYDIQGAIKVSDGRNGARMDFHDRLYMGIEDTPQTAQDDFIVLSIRPDGSVWQCHGELGKIGDVYENTIDISSIRPRKCTNGFHTLCPTEDTVLKVMKEYPEEL
jgi:hypothetical protein